MRLITSTRGSASSTLKCLLVALTLTLAPAALADPPSAPGDDDISPSPRVAQEAEGETEAGGEATEGAEEAGGEAVVEAAGTEMAGPERYSGEFVVGIHVGPFLPVFSDLDPFFILPRLELGYRFPAWGGRLQPFFSAAYTEPTADGTETDARIASGGYTWEIRQKELMLGLGLLVRFLEWTPDETWNGYAALAPVLFLLETVADGASTAGEPFGENTETGTEVGLYFGAGAEYHIGPGAAFLELSLTWSDLDTFITGNSNTGALTPALGYRFMF